MSRWQSLLRLLQLDDEQGRGNNRRLDSMLWTKILGVVCELRIGEKTKGLVKKGIEFCVWEFYERRKKEKRADNALAEMNSIIIKYYIFFI